MRCRLVVMRHAKSSWDDESLTDHERPLNDRGRREAPLVGARLVELGWQPDLIISSDSCRTRETLDGLSRAFDGHVDHDFRQDFYHAGVEAVVAAVSQVPADRPTIMVLGHNPGWEHVVQYLSGEAVTMKTSTAVLLEIDRDNWRQAICDRGGWELIDVISPKEL